MRTCLAYRHLTASRYGDRGHRNSPDGVSALQQPTSDSSTVGNRQGGSGFAQCTSERGLSALVRSSREGPRRECDEQLKAYLFSNAFCIEVVHLDCIGWAVAEECRFRKMHESQLGRAESGDQSKFVTWRFWRTNSLANPCGRGFFTREVKVSLPPKCEQPTLLVVAPIMHVS